MAYAIPDKPGSPDENDDGNYSELQPYERLRSSVTNPEASQGISDTGNRLTVSSGHYNNYENLSPHPSSPLENTSIETVSSRISGILKFLQKIFG